MIMQLFVFMEIQISYNETYTVPNHSSKKISTWKMPLKDIFYMDNQCNSCNMVNSHEN